MSQAHMIHVGASAIGNGLVNAIIANQRDRAVAKANAEAEANSVASVRRLAAMLAAAQKENAALRVREAALATEVEGLREDLACAHAALRRVL